jgi:hypothetical protein
MRNCFFVKASKSELENAMKWAAVLSLVSWLLAGLLVEDLILSALVGILSFFPPFLFLLHWPEAKRREHAALVEAGMPLHLMNIAMELNLGIAFEAALENSGKGDDACSEEFANVLEEIKGQGASVQHALRHFGERLESTLVKRAATQLSAAFEQKGRQRGEPLKRIATEILARQRVEGKLFSGKMVVSSLLFIGVSAIVPALFQSFSIVGSAVLNLGFTAMQLFLIVAVGFPLLDLAVLLYIRSRTPVFLREQ